MRLASSATEQRFVASLGRHVFSHRVLILALFAVITALMAYAAITGLRIDTKFTKQLPLEHEYMKTFVEHQAEFGGANRILVAVLARDGNMFTPEFFQALKVATDEVFFIEGVDRARVQSLWTPNTRYTEVVEGGIEAGDVIPSDFRPDAEGYLASLGGPLPYMVRLREIEAMTRAHEEALAAARDRLASEVRPAELADVWRAEVERWSFDEVNDLIERHNRWYPVEARLPMDPRRGDYALVNGRDYRRQPLGPAWTLDRFPPDGAQAGRSRATPRDAATSVSAQSTALQR